MKKLLFTLSTLLLSVTSFAQTASDAKTQTLKINILEHAILEIGAPTHDFGIAAPTVAGASITIANPTFNSYIRTSLMTAYGFGSHGSLKVTMTNLPDGFSLKMSMEVPAGVVGNPGTIAPAYDYSTAPDGAFLFNGTSTQLVGIMGSHHTGVGAAQGFTARYELSIDEMLYSMISESNNDVSLIYTLAN